MSNFTEALDDSAETIDACDNVETREHTPSAELVLFARYRTVRELGRGGMGVVVLAHDTVLDLQVALKLIPQSVVRDTEGIVDLKKEVLRGMELTHPGIVRVFSFEQDATTAAIVMEYVQGQSLAQKKALRPSRCFDYEEVLPWLEQLCAALDYAHTEARIAHRDLKPGNLMLTAAGRLKVADFGIASSLSDTLSRVSVRADSSGTPPYMSPQQAMGHRPAHLDDIYSLGATVYELLTGKPPFFRGNILAQLMQEEPVTMTQRRQEFGTLDLSPIPPAWEKVVAACLAKDPTERPQSGAAILEFLKNPERALALRPSLPADLKLEIVPSPRQLEEVQVAPSMVAQTAQVVRWQPDEEVMPVVKTVPAFWGIVSGLGQIVAAVIRPVFKIALVFAALWAFLHLKGKWDSLEAKRAAETAKLQASQRAAEPDIPAVRSHPAPIQPPPYYFPPPGPPPGMGGGEPPPHLRPPPPRR